ncbi:hypothetical protein A3Q56_08391 [Intoshia linei]|uniref:Uncharacterized protein n=1 Tax=Intoshia linei TaxID=1819745 RepID=A0A177ARM9_9BILA|nr:hypothetical protein A3Q56_08391 [Intoshia linei]
MEKYLNKLKYLYNVKNHFEKIYILLNGSNKVEAQYKIHFLKNVIGEKAREKVRAVNSNNLNSIKQEIIEWNNKNRKLQREFIHQNGTIPTEIFEYAKFLRLQIWEPMNQNDIMKINHVLITPDDALIAKLSIPAENKVIKVKFMVDIKSKINIINCEFLKHFPNIRICKSAIDIIGYNNSTVNSPGKNESIIEAVKFIIMFAPEVIAQIQNLSVSR